MGGRNIPAAALWEDERIESQHAALNVIGRVNEGAEDLD